MKPFINASQQINTLRNRNLLVKNQLRAEKALMRYGYYEIVNGYKHFLLDPSKTNEEYKEGSTFEKLLDLYELDKEIRSAVLVSTLEIELSLRTAIAYTLAETFGVNEQAYLNYRNFKQGNPIWRPGNNPTNERAKMLDILHEILNRQIEPLNHYRSVHNHIPPWILLKETSFGNLKHIFKLLKGPQKKKVISICYSIDEGNVTQAHIDLFKDSLAVINCFRNRAAHNGRMFNFKPNTCAVKYNSLFHSVYAITPADYRNGKGINDLYTFYKLLSYFENDHATNKFEFYVPFFLYEYCKKYPSDLQLFVDGMGFPIEEMQKLIDKFK